MNLSFNAVFVVSSGHSGCLPVGVRGTLGAPGSPVQAKCDIWAKTSKCPIEFGISCSPCYTALHAVQGSKPSVNRLSLVRIRPGEPALNSSFDFSGILPLFGKPRGRFATGCSFFDLVHRGHGKPFLIRSLRVPRDLAQAGVARNGRDLVLGAASLRQDPGRGLPKPVCAAMRQPRRVALFAEPIAEPGGFERLAELCGQERQVIRRRIGNDGSQVGVHRDRQLGAGLLLPDLEHTIPDMLSTHSNNIRATLSRIEK